MRPLLTLSIILALAPAPARAQAPYEPNDSPASAFGPLVTGTYSAAIETINDRDLYRVYVAVPEQQVIVDAHNATPPEQFDATVSVGIYDARLERRAYACVVSPGESARVGATLGPGVYFVGVERGCLPGDAGAAYALSVSGGLVDAATMEAACRAAGVRGRAAARSVRAARRRLAHARRHGSARAIKQARARLERTKRDRDAARRAARAVCVPR